jgi:hypothetical protein
MKQGIQVELENEELRINGCYFLSIAQLASGCFDFKEFDLVRHWGFCKEHGYINRENEIVDGAAIYKYFSGKPCKLIKTGIPPKTASYIVRNQKPGYTHYTAVIDGKTWDPLPPLRTSAKSYRIASYRIFETSVDGC